MYISLYILWEWKQIQVVSSEQQYSVTFYTVSNRYAIYNYFVNGVTA